MLVQTLLMVIWIPAGTMVWGLSGAAASIAASSFVSTIFLVWRSNGTFSIRMGRFFSHSIFPALVPLLPALLIFGVSELWPQTGRLNLLIQILLCGTAFVLSSAGLLWKFVLNDAEKTKAIELLPLKKLSVR
jgi:hypothetical protein